MKTAARLLCFLSLALAFIASAQAQTTWTQRNLATGTGEYLWSVTDGNAGIVAVGTGGKIVHSIDGKTWTTRTSGTTGWLVAVTYGNGRYLAVGEGGTILSSTDAITWTAVSTTGTTARLNNILYAQGKFVAVGEGGAIVVSTNGTTWAAATSGISGWLHGLAYGGGRWIATGQSGAITTSSDGTTWTKRSGNTTLDLEAVVYTESTSYSYSNYTYSYAYYLAVGANGTAQVIYFTDYVYPSNPSANSTNISSYSTSYYDPATRTYLTGTGTTARLRSLSYANRVLIATGENGTIRTSKSTSGPWTTVTINTAKNLVGANAVRDTLMLVGESEAIFQSEAIFTSRLGNISTRGVAGTGGGIMIAGTVVEGTKPKQFLIRGSGPALTAFGVTGALADPVLSVYNGSGNLVATNTAWGTNLNPSAIVAAASAAGAFPFATNSKDSALLLTLSPGSYTFQLSSAAGASGVTLVEASDLDTIDSTSARAINISTRGQVGTGENILIAGLVVQGQASRTLLIRGIGPTLGQFGVAGTLGDPILKVLASDGTVLATNDNWSDSTTISGRTISSDDIVAANALTGAFALAANSKDSALLITLVPGSYTIQLSGVSNSTGVALVEAYDVPQN